MRLQSSLYLMELRERQRHRFRIVGGNTVPDIFRKLNSLCDGEIQKIGSWLAHGKSIDR